MSSTYFDELYSSNKHYFGDHPENMLRDYFAMCDKKGRVLDVGIGQGRNARFFLQQGYGVDGIDISAVAIENLKKWIHGENLDLNLFHMDFNRFNCSPKTYSAILLFNLFPVLSEAQIDDLAEKSRKWLKNNGLIFVTGYTTNENNAVPARSDWKKTSNNSFTDNYGNFRTFLDIDDVIAKFRKFKTIYKFEGYGERHMRNDGHIEQHHIFELILQKI